MPCQDAGKTLAEALADEEAGVAKGNKNLAYRERNQGFV